MKKIMMSILLALSFVTVAQESNVKLRIGWQVPWSLQGQLVQVWKNTDILKKHGIEAEFIGKTYGPELNELAMADAIDVVLTADQPAAVLFSKGKGWVGVMRLMYNRTSTYVPVNSDIKKITDLKGKTIGVPFGAAAQRVTVEALKANGLNPDADVQMINLAMTEHAPLVKKAVNEKKWDQFDALSGFDPIPAILEARNEVRVIDTGKVCSMVLMNENFLAKNPKVAQKLSLALVDAYEYYKKNTQKVDEWFMKEANFSKDDYKALAIANSLEPNIKFKIKKDIRVTFTEDDFLLMQKGADFVEKATQKKINMKDFVSNKYLK